VREVYIVKHDVFSYEDYSYDSSVEVFYDENSARNYFEIKKEEIMQEYYDYIGTDNAQELENNSDFYSSELALDGLPHLFVDLIDYGSDKLTIQKKDVMSF
jgi:hypothetical protein